MMHWLAIFISLLVAHLIFDYPMQGDFLSKAKNRFAPIPGAPWYQAMAAHAFMQGFAVMIVTGSYALGAAEILAHALIDHNKCAGRISFNTDQFLHIGCKVAWVAILLAMEA